MSDDDYKEAARASPFRVTDAAPRQRRVDAVRRTHQAPWHPVGTALDVDVLLLIETPLPWPKPVFGHNLLDGLDGVFDTPVGTARILAAAPSQLGPPQLIVLRRVAGDTQMASIPFGSRPELHAHIADISDGRLPETSPAEPTVLVCTQGSHDICCGSEGMRFARALELSRPDVRVFHVSHTGGHKFAPTAMTLPDGRMWANLNIDLVERILDRTIAPAEVGDHCRGWWGAAQGPAQAAERAAFVAVGWEWDSLERSVSPVTSDAAEWTFQVTGGDHSFEVAVEVSRHVPTITCRAEGGLPAKPGKEYRATIV